MTTTRITARTTSPTTTSTTTSTLDQVTRLLAAGVTVDGVAARLGLPADLVEAMVGELTRLGVVAPSRSGRPESACGSCVTTACRGCPMSAPSHPCAPGVTGH